MKNASDTSEMTLGTQIMIASELGSIIVLTVVLGYLGGNWLDGFFKTSPYCVIAGLMLGMGLGLAIVVRRSDQLDKVKIKPDLPPSPPAGTAPSADSSAQD
jgi:F0F1-type ATP synthase assembly protein I